MTARRVRSLVLDELGARLRARRQALGLSRDALASALGVSARVVQEWEGGRIDPPATRVVQVARALGCEPGAILDGIADDPDLARLPDPIPVPGAAVLATARRIEALAPDGRRMVEAALSLASQETARPVPLDLRNLSN